MKSLNAKTDKRQFQSFKSKPIIKYSKIKPFQWYLTRYTTRNIFEVMMKNIVYFRIISFVFSSFNRKYLKLEEEKKWVYLSLHVNSSHWKL